MFESFKNKIKSVFSRRKYVLFDRNPDRDWKVIFITFVIVCVGIAFADYYLYTRINKGEIFLIAKKDLPILITIDKNLLSKTVKFYEDKKVKQDGIRRSGFISADPSL